MTNQKAPIYRLSRAGLRFLAGLALVIAGQPVPSFATVPVDLELVLAVDVSGSMDREEAEMQRAGYVSALVDPKVLRAIRSGYHGRIAATYVEWSGWDHNEVITGWWLLESEESVRAFSDVIAAAPLTRGRYTSISGAIEFSLPLFDQNAYESKRRVIDVSGDGPNNSGRLVLVARDEAVAAGITINGLPIVNDRIDPFGWPQLPLLDLYYESCVIGGPRAFMVVAEGFHSFATAIRKKLVIEIADLAPADVEWTGLERAESFWWRAAPEWRAPSFVLRAAPNERAPTFVPRASLDGRAPSYSGRIAHARPRPESLHRVSGGPLPGTASLAEVMPPSCDAGERMLHQRMMQWQWNLDQNR